MYGTYTATLTITDNDHTVSNNIMTVTVKETSMDLDLEARIPSRATSLQEFSIIKIMFTPQISNVGKFE
ncbi:hypothetical protein [Anabaena sp. PCC 7108]|uniref:hypothetical protein n=1 Tax=Anabaena sp. PCC 7108 TaxID=163908 RepID=UPI0011818FC5|nr:hypothetical protein [Anabaena sp. PCC 7108]